MIKSKFTFFQMQAKSTFADTSELIEPCFCNSPKVLNPIDMVMAVSEFIASMLDPIVFFITNVYKSITGLKSVGINGRVLIDFLLYNGRYFSFSKVIAAAIISPVVAGDRALLESNPSTATIYTG